MLYERAIRPLLFRAWEDPETAHERMLAAMEAAQTSSTALALVSRLYGVQDKRLETKVGSLTFPNPVGLAAGFDKKGRVVPFVQAMGFGFVSTGTFTPKPQEGWPRPRIWRDGSRHAILNRMGFPGDGVAAGSHALARMRAREDVFIPVGASIGMQKDTPPKEAVRDYCACVAELFGLVDYIEINVSSPNTVGLRGLQAIDQLSSILSYTSQEIQDLTSLHRGKVPDIWLKIAPDMKDSFARDIVALAIDCGVSALVATNTMMVPVPGQPDLTCGQSGAPLFPIARNKVRVCAEAADGKLPIVAVGGISGPRHVQHMADAGATLFQLYTGLIYRGPKIARTLNNAYLRHVAAPC